MAIAWSKYADIISHQDIRKQLGKYTSLADAINGGQIELIRKAQDMGLLTKEQVVDAQLQAAGNNITKRAEIILQNYINDIGQLDLEKAVKNGVDIQTIRDAGFTVSNEDYDKLKNPVKPRQDYVSFKAMPINLKTADANTEIKNQLNNLNKIAEDNIYPEGFKGFSAWQKTEDGKFEVKYIINGQENKRIFNSQDEASKWEDRAYDAQYGIWERILHNITGTPIDEFDVSLKGVLVGLSKPETQIVMMGAGAAFDEAITQGSKVANLAVNALGKIPKPIIVATNVGMSGVSAYSTAANWNNMTVNQKVQGIGFSVLPLLMLKAVVYKAPKSEVEIQSKLVDDFILKNGRDFSD
jgi:hypothetical protein